MDDNFGMHLILGISETAYVAVTDDYTGSFRYNEHFDF